jgi:hypothetical protein
MGDTNVDVQKSPDANFAAGDGWVSVLESNLIMADGVKTSAMPTPLVINGEVAIGDYFRVNVPVLNQNIKGLTIQVDVRI